MPRRPTPELVASIDWALVAQLAQQLNPLEDIQEVLKLGKQDFKRAVWHKCHLSPQRLIERHQAEGRAAMRAAQFAKAVEDRNPTMLRWMGMQYLDQSPIAAITYKPAPTQPQQPQAAQSAGFEFTTPQGITVLTPGQSHLPGQAKQVHDEIPTVEVVMNEESTVEAARSTDVARPQEEQVLVVEYFKGNK